MKDRRPMGSLEYEVLAALWATGEASTPADVRATLSSPLGYTTVATVLTRLSEKGLVQREPAGRGYAYKPILTEAELTAHKMLTELTQSGDRKATLAQFVGTLTKRDEQTLRKLLDSLED